LHGTTGEKEAEVLPMLNRFNHRSRKKSMS